MFVSLEKLKPVVTFLATVNTKYESQYPVFEPEIDCSKRPISVAERVNRYEYNSEKTIDLIELIGGTWPGNTFTEGKKSEKAATDVSSEPVTKVTRNKSLNIVSHLISNKKTVKMQPKNDAGAIVTEKSTGSQQGKGTE